MTKIISTNNGQQYQTASNAKTAGAIYAGALASSAVSGIAQSISLPCVEKMKKLSESCDSVQIRDAVKKTFGGGALPGKGVEIIDVVTPKSENDFIKNLGKIFKGASLKDLHPENAKLVDAIDSELPKLIKKSPIGKFCSEVLLNMFEQGNNACFMSKANKVVANFEKLGLSAFHEMGHAINHNCSKFWNVMQKMRGTAKLAGGLVASVALFKRKKVEGEQPKNTFDKVTTFIKNNVGKLVTLSFVPMVAEELMASHRGNKMAAQVLPKDILKKVKASNRLGAVTYIAVAIATGVGAYVASKVRDKITQPKQVA